MNSFIDGYSSGVAQNVNEFMEEGVNNRGYIFQLSAHSEKDQLRTIGEKTTSVNS